MTQQKGNAKSIEKKPSLTTAKTKQKTDKQPAKSVSEKRPVSTSKTEKPAMKYTQSEIAFKKSLESLNALIDIIPSIFSNIGKEKAQDMSKTIVDSILVILKYIPKIKEAELLSAYKKTIKRIAGFLHAINLKLESREFSPTEQIVTEDSIITDENKIQIVESISPDNYPCYVEKYPDGRLVVHTLLSKETFEYRERNPDKDAGKFIHKIRNSRIALDMTDEKYDEYDFKPINSITIDKNVYADYLDEKFDIKLVNLLFENNELRHNISRLKNKKSLEIILTAASSRPCP